jgi:hypothetical protein
MKRARQLNPERSVTKSTASKKVIYTNFRLIIPNGFVLLVLLESRMRGRPTFDRSPDEALGSSITAEAVLLQTQKQLNSYWCGRGTDSPDAV